MKPGASGATCGRAGLAAWAVGLALALSFPGVALAASSEASPVVTVPGSVTSVEGTVSLGGPVVVSLTADGASALASAVAGALRDQSGSAGTVTVAASADDLAFRDYERIAWAVVVLGVASLVGARVVGW